MCFSLLVVCPFCRDCSGCVCERFGIAFVRLRWDAKSPCWGPNPHFESYLGPPVVPFYPFFGSLGSPTQIGRKKRIGTLLTDKEITNEWQGKVNNKYKKIENKMTKIIR